MELLTRWYPWTASFLGLEYPGPVCIVAIDVAFTVIFEVDCIKYRDYAAYLPYFGRFVFLSLCLSVYLSVCLPDCVSLCGFQYTSWSWISAQTSQNMWAACGNQTSPSTAFPGHPYAREGGANSKNVVLVPSVSKGWSTSSRACKLSFQNDLFFIILLIRTLQ